MKRSKDNAKHPCHPIAHPWDPSDDCFRFTTTHMYKGIHNQWRMHKRKGPNQTQAMAANHEPPRECERNRWRETLKLNAVLSILCKRESIRNSCSTKTRIAPLLALPCGMQWEEGLRFKKGSLAKTHKAFLQAALAPATIGPRVIQSPFVWVVA